MPTQKTILGDDEPVLVKAGRLAALLGVSEVTINKYRADGMVAIKRADERGKLVWHYDVDDCRAWFARHAADAARGETHGGKRMGAGRTRKSVGAAVQELRESAMRAERGDLQMDLRQHVSGGGGGQRAMPTTVEGILEEMQAGSLSGVEARTLVQGMMAASKSQEIQIERGELLHRDDVEEVWVGHIQTFRTLLRGIPARASQQMRMQFNLKPEETAAVRKIVQEEIDKVEGFMARDMPAETSAKEAEEEESAEGGEEEE